MRDIVLPAVPPEMTSKCDIDSEAKEANAISFCARKRVLNCHVIHIFIGIALSVLLASSKVFLSPSELVVKLL